MPLAYQNIEGNTFSAENIRNCEEHILSIQRSSDKAVADNDKDSIQGLLNLLIRKSTAVRVLATWRITQRNQGKYTAGIDGIAIPKDQNRNVQNQLRLKILDKIDIEKTPDSIRRVFIPKPNGKQCTAYGFLDHSLKEDCAIITISLKGVSNGETQKIHP